MTEIFETQTRFDSSIKEGEQTVKSVTFETESGNSYRYFDRDFDTEKSFTSTIIFTKVEVSENG